MELTHVLPMRLNTSMVHARHIGLYLCLLLCPMLLIACSNRNGSSQSTGEETADRVLMAVFAHPDDEGTVGPILRKFARQGVEVILVTATDGRLGTNDFSGLPAGDTLATIRRGELRCAAEKLGVELIHLDYEDQFRAAEGYDGFIPQSRGLIRDVHRIISERKPNAILTFGPDGFSNHIDHRLVGATVTHVLVNEDWEEPPEVYYVGSPASQMSGDSRMLRGVQDRYLTVRIPYTDEDEEVALEAAACHESQFPPEAIERWRERSAEEENLVYLRPFVAPSGPVSNTLF